MKQLHPNSVGLVVGTTFGLMHFVWSVIVMMGWAQACMDFIFSLHFLSNPYVMQVFDWGKAIMLIALTFVVGYVLGWIFTLIWNMMMINSKR